MQEPKPPRRKLRVLWILAAFVLLFGVWFCYQLFGPNPAIVVSKETTFITEPLGEDGLPNYEAYLLQQGSEGVTPENNAAVLIWQAMWPGELEQQHWLLICNALGMEKVPSTKEALVAPYDETVRDKIAMELAERFTEQASKNAADGSKEDYFSETWQEQLIERAAYDLVGEAGERPWTSEQIPALAQWVEQNQKPLDMLVEASKRPRYYSPSPNMLDGSKDMLLASPLPSVQMIRGTARALPVRAMWHLGEGRTAEAWQDLLACHRIARLTSENFSLVGQLVALAIDGVTCNVTVPFLHHANLDAEAARQVLADLQGLGPASHCAQTMGQGERLQFLDTVLYITTDDHGPGDLANHLGIPTELEFVCRARVDWNEVLRKGNAWFDELVAAAKLPTLEERRAAFDRTDQKLARMSSQVKNPSAWVGSVLNGKRRTEMAKDLLISYMLPATSASLNAEDRTNTQLEITRLAAALAVYRAEQRAYPEELADLVPGVLLKLPVDLYSGQSFLYERKDDGGYLLYSVFENGIDDGGDSIMNGEVINGEWGGEQPEGFDYSKSDLVIRVPVPEFEFPTLPNEFE